MLELKRKGTVRRQKKDSNIRDQGIKQLYPEKNTYVPEVDIVLVPGLATNPEECWGDKNFNWPTDSLAKDFPKSRILLYMYESEWKGPFKVKQFMDNLAMGLLKGIDASRDKESERRPIVFIGHSMGGLVIAKAVFLADFHRKRFPVLFETIAATVFFGTPFKGSEAAVVGNMVASFGESFGQTVPTKLLEFMEPGNSQLRELVDQFTNRVRQVSPNIAITCFWEQHETSLSGLMKVSGPWPTIPLPEKLAMFVTRESATLEGYDNFGLNTNHRGLVKFSSAQDYPFKTVRHEIKDLVNGAESTVKGRINSVRGIDHREINAIDDALDGGYTPARRKAAISTFSPSPWITEEPEYTAWLAENTPEDDSSTAKPGDCLWVRAHEGRGKTSASMAVISHYEQREAAAQKQNPVRIAYFFCDQSQYFCTAEDVLKSLIRQLIKQQESLASYARLFIKKAKGEASQAQITIENLWQALQDMLTDAFIGSKVIFVLNNLHVLPETSTSTNKLMKFIHTELRDMHEMGSRRVLTRWFITSRDVHHVGEALRVDGVRLVDLQDPKYKNQVQITLKEAAKSKVESLVKKKNYSKALAYFVGSVLGKRAQNTQWIDISYVQLVELAPDVNDLKVRRVIETLPQDLRTLLNQAWYQVFKANSEDLDTITEILRTLILTYENPTEQELGILAGLGTSEEDKKEVNRLIEICKPLLSIQRDGKVSFINPVVRSHLLENAKDLLDMSDEEIKWQHGVIALRCFERIKEAFDVEIDLDEDSEEDEVGSDNDSNGDSDSNESDEGAESDTGNEDWDGESQSDASDDDPEVDKVWGLAEEYVVKHWLRHASKATFEIAEDLSAEEDFWVTGSRIRRRWLIEYSRMTDILDNFYVKQWTALHVVASIGFQDLLAALIRNGHEDEIIERDELENTPLHLAAEFGRTKIIQELLNHKAPVNDGIDGDGGTPLHMAAYMGHIDAMGILLRGGADPIAASDEEGPVVNAAISSGNRKAVELLVNRGVPLVMDGNFDSPLALAALLSNPDMFEYLIEQYADRLPAKEYSEALVKSAEAKRTEVFNKLLQYEHEDIYFQRALDSASEKQNWEIVKVLIELRPGLDCNSLFVSAAAVNDDKDDLLRVAWDFSKGTIRRETVDRALYVATDCEKASTVEILLAEPYRANPNATGSEYGNALTASAHDGTEHIIDMLLEAGASVNDPAGWALQAAAAKGHKDIVVRFLEQEGANVNAFTRNDNFPAGTALQAACEAGELEIVEILLAHGADPNLGGGDEGPPVIAATKHVEDEILQRLVRAGARLDIRGGADQSTPLTNAAECYNEEAILMLLDAGADINLADGKGDTALMVTCAEEDGGCIADVLLDRGADILRVNDDGKNVLQIALETGDDYCVGQLVERTSALFTALREAMEQGNMAVTSVVRSVEASKQGLDYGDEDDPAGDAEDESGHSGEAHRDRTAGSIDDSAYGSSVQGETTPPARNSRYGTPQQLSEERNSASRTQFSPYDTTSSGHVASYHHGNTAPPDAAQRPQFSSQAGPGWQQWPGEPSQQTPAFPSPGSGRGDAPPVIPQRPAAVPARVSSPSGPIRRKPAPGSHEGYVPSSSQSTPSTPPSLAPRLPARPYAQGSQQSPPQAQPFVAYNPGSMPPMPSSSSYFPGQPTSSGAPPIAPKPAEYTTQGGGYYGNNQNAGSGRDGHPSGVGNRYSQGPGPSPQRQQQQQPPYQQHQQQTFSPIGQNPYSDWGRQQQRPQGAPQRTPALERVRIMSNEFLRR